MQTREEDRESRTGPPISRPNIRPLALIVLSGCDCRGPPSYAVFNAAPTSTLYIHSLSGAGVWKSVKAVPTPVYLGIITPIKRKEDENGPY
ncbi:hypothetical protein TcasGA2_TC033078 [Tribolium castaneum]|uniref:Uncharacterized protein n=1 Tax=Tribolium castaneum TaxID=7070 RepID=A0A139WI29_TRICA|nr:hypothetical protein TcasGA2_TC033078 [Tribolium castaneum]